MCVCAWDWQHRFHQLLGTHTLAAFRIRSSIPSLYFAPKWFSINVKSFRTYLVHISLVCEIHSERVVFYYYEFSPRSRCDRHYRHHNRYLPPQHMHTIRLVNLLSREIDICAQQILLLQRDNVHTPTQHFHPFNFWLPESRWVCEASRSTFFTVYSNNTLRFFGLVTWNWCT